MADSALKFIGLTLIQIIATFGFGLLPTWVALAIFYDWVVHLEDWEMLKFAWVPMLNAFAWQSFIRWADDKVND